MELEIGSLGTTSSRHSSVPWMDFVERSFGYSIALTGLYFIRVQSHQVRKKTLTIDRRIERNVTNRGEKGKFKHQGNLNASHQKQKRFQYILRLREYKSIVMQN